MSRVSLTIFFLGGGALLNLFTNKTDSKACQVRLDITLQSVVGRTSSSPEPCTPIIRMRCKSKETTAFLAHQIRISVGFTHVRLICKGQSKITESWLISFYWVGSFD